MGKGAAAVVFADEVEAAIAMLDRAAVKTYAMATSAASDNPAPCSDGRLHTATTSTAPHASRADSDSVRVSLVDPRGH